MGCCLLVLAAFGAPRVATILWWIFDPTRFSGTFSNWLLPVVGIFILPWTTLAYVFVYPGGISTFDWFILIAALIIDLGVYGGGSRSRGRWQRD